MNSLEFINEEIEKCKQIREKIVNHYVFLIEHNGGYVQKKQAEEERDYINNRLDTLRQIKTELEVIEIIKLGCTGLKYNSDGGSVLKLGNINAMNFINLNNRLDKICDWSDE